MKRSELELQEIRTSIASHLRNGMNIGSAIYAANGLVNEDLPADKHVDEEFYIAKYVESGGTESRSLQGIEGSVQHLKDQGYSGADLQKLLLGHSFEYIKERIRKRENRNLLKEVKIEFSKFFDEYWTNRFQAISGLRLTSHHGFLANSVFPVVKGMGFDERLSAFSKEKGFNDVETDWAIIDRQSLKPSGGLKIFIKDKLGLVELPRAVVVNSKFSSQLDGAFTVQHMSGSHIILTVSKGISPFELDLLWGDILNELQSLLDSIAKSNGFASLHQWNSMSNEFPSAFIKTMGQYGVAVEKKKEKALSKKPAKAPFFNYQPLLNQASEDSSTLANNLVRLNATARSADFLSSRDRRSLYVLKRKILLALTKAKYAKITKLCKRTKDIGIKEYNLKSNVEVALTILPLLFNKSSRANKYKHDVLKHLTIKHKGKGWDSIVQDETILHEIGGDFKESCKLWAELYDENMIWGVRRAVGSAKAFLTLLDQSTVEPELLTALSEAGNSEGMLRSGFYDVFEFMVGDKVFHMPKDVVPMWALNELGDLPREDYPLEYRFGTDSAAGCADLSEFCELLEALSVDWRLWSFTPKLMSRIEALNK